MFGGVGEFGRAGFQAEGARRGVMGDLAERDDHADGAELLQRFLEERAASGDLDRFWLVGGGQSFDRVEDDCAG